MRFEEVPYEERVLFLPHCLRNLNQCKNNYDLEGLVCEGHSNCTIGRLKSYAEELGYKNIFIVGGGSIVFKLIEKYKPKAVVGIACEKEIELAIEKLEKPESTKTKSKILYQTIPLLRDGCVNTEVDEKEARRAIA